MIAAALLFAAAAAPPIAFPPSGTFAPKSAETALVVEVAQLVDGAPSQDPHARFKQARRARIGFAVRKGALRATMSELVDDDTFDGVQKVYPSIGAAKEYVVDTAGERIALRRAQPGGFGYVDDGSGLGKVPTGSEDDDVRAALAPWPQNALGRALRGRSLAPGDVVRLDAAAAAAAFPLQKEGMFAVRGARLTCPSSSVEAKRVVARCEASVDVAITDPEWTGAPFVVAGEVLVDVAGLAPVKHALTGRFTALQRDGTTVGGTLTFTATLQ